MKHLEIMPILEASEMISVKFSHEDKDLSILPFLRELQSNSLIVYTLYMEWLDILSESGRIS